LTTVGDARKLAKVKLSQLGFVYRLRLAPRSSRRFAVFNMRTRGPFTHAWTRIGFTRSKARVAGGCCIKVPEAVYLAPRPGHREASRMRAVSFGSYPWIVSRVWPVVMYAWRTGLSQFLVAQDCSPRVFCINEHVPRDRRPRICEARPTLLLIADQKLLK